ncbi:MAG: 5'/3'-nucleotidase SurE [Clostridia bacterium]
MRILITNDDGIISDGLLSLAKVLSKQNEIFVIAPDSEYSGAGHSLSFFKPINYTQVQIDKNCTYFKISGTPCDCVKFGVEYLLKLTPPDFIISGINNVANLGTDVVYSGTINAAMEGSILGIKSIAVSCDVLNNDYTFCNQFIAKNLDTFVELIKNCSMVLSINIPSKTPKGIKFVKVGNRKFFNEYQFVKERGYILTGYPVNTQNDDDCDVVQFAKGYITISPIKVEYNDFINLERLKKVQL